MRIHRSILTALLAAVAALPLAASAHTGVDGGMHHGFVTGFMHPLTGADHLAAMVAVGLGVGHELAAVGKAVRGDCQFGAVAINRGHLAATTFALANQALG